MYMRDSTAGGDPPYPGDIIRACKKAIELIEQDPTRRKKLYEWREKKSQYKDWNRAFDNWLKRARPSKPRQKLFVVDDPDPYGLENAPF